jgi:hypothetical protein
MGYGLVDLTRIMQAAIFCEIVALLSKRAITARCSVPNAIAMHFLISKHLLSALAACQIPILQINDNSNI